MKKTVQYIFIFISLNLHAQIERIDPPNWWVGMRTKQITLLVYGSAIQDLEPSINYSGVKILKTEKVESPNYLFVTIDIDSNTIPGDAKIEFKKNGKTKITKSFPLLNREKNSANRIGFSTKDAILLIVPDRFANGNPKNDNTPKSIEKANRNDESGRHGGDIQGIINHLDYIQSLGYTQIWNTPLVENNMPNYSYHGYAATDFYKIDERFGTNEEFKTLVSEAKKRNIGLIWDVVLNHCGSQYYFIKDVPTKDWMNFQDSKKRTNHIKSTLLDPYATIQDREEYTNGWFDGHMPDLNQKNPLVASYLTQNTIWWIEYANLSGFREDTFSYADKDFLSNWTKTIMDEYPNFNIVGEEMTNVTELSAYWQKDKINADGYRCFLPTLMDFSLTDNLIKSLSTNNDWESTWKEFYKGMGQDYHYANPNNLLIFPDNHDMDRFYTRIKNDFESWKLGMTLYTTMRGIPQLYYGTELLFTNEKAGNDGQRRADLFGGWEGDTKNAITEKGLDAKELEAQKYLSKLLNWRKTATVIHNGKFIHYAPEKNDVYVYFRYNENQKVMVILNKNKEKVLLDMKKYYKMIPETFTAKDIINDREITIQKTLEIAPRSALILDLNK
ncbi:glycoside hydrolase family 13 protein [Flavobacterium myungsuense]|uniref:Glycoside hydrolase family 13 protein n=2 Tax=Flavobacterium myungsuense TaxID=651823 RepID=A0ABW3IY58_9FLAO